MERYNFKEDAILQSNLLAGEASTEERVALEIWRLTQTENNEFWLNLEEAIKLETATIAGFEADAKIGWKKVQAGIIEAEMHNRTTKPQTVAFTKRIAIYSAIAASFIGIIFLSINFLLPKEINSIEVATNKNEVKEILLADGSQVTVNSASKLIHPTEFSDNQRIVSLNGEAFFKVAKNKEKPFIVKTNGLEVKVVGTQFNVRDFGANSKILQVTVLEGIVEVLPATHDQAKITLTKGQSAELNTLTHAFTKLINQNKNSASWKTKQFEFNKTELSEVLNVLSNAYKIDLKINNNAILNQKLTANFENRDIDFIMKTIASTFNFKYSLENGVVTIN